MSATPQTSSARANILARLRSKPVPPLPQPTVQVWTSQMGDQPVEVLRQSLKSNLEAAHAEVIQAGPEGWRATLQKVCQDQGIKTLMLPRSLPPTLDIAPWDQGPALSRFDQPMETLKDSLFNQVDAGFTLAECAIADTGTLVLLSSPEQPRSLSLVPPVHICLLDVRRLHTDMPTALAREQWASAMPTNLIFVSGPSKTADIQQTLAYGAHGPKSLIVILVEEDLQ